MKKVSIILPAYNEEASMQLLHDTMVNVAEQHPGYAWEFLIVNDGSSDRTLQLAQDIHREDERFCVLDLSRNYGKEIAMLAGFDYATGDAVIVMDADMQHPIAPIAEMLKYWEEGYQDVFASRTRTRRQTGFKKTTSRLYYKLLQATTRIPIQQNTGDFRLLDRICVNAIREIRESQRNTKGIYSWIGYRKKEINYDEKPRVHGKTKWNIWSLVNLALDGITSFTTAPLRIATIFGFTCSIIGFMYLLYILVKTIIYGDPVAGYPTIMVTILFIGGVQLLCLGIIGEYLGRLFNESKHRPAYFANTYNGVQLDPENAPRHS